MVRTGPKIRSAEEHRVPWVYMFPVINSFRFCNLTTQIFQDLIGSKSIDILEKLLFILLSLLKNI